MERKVSFYSDGLKIAGTLYEPEGVSDTSCPGIVMCQGMLGNKDYFRFPHVARQFVATGYVALTWDFRGVGESEGDPARLYPLEMAEDIVNALTFLQVQPKVDPKRLALVGWSWGGGMVPYVAGLDERVRCAISVLGFGDGKRSMHSLRRPWEWLEFLALLEEDRKSRVVTGHSKQLSLAEFWGADPSINETMERDLSKIPGMEGVKIGAYSLATADKLMEFRPIDVVDRISPRPILYIAGEKDLVTPAEEIAEMHKLTKEPKALKVIPGISHYDVYEEPYLSQVIQMATSWLKEHLG